MKLINRIHLSPLRLAGHLALVTTLAPFAWAEETPKSDGKMPPIKVDPSPLTQVAGTLTTFAPVVEKVAPSVVTISTSKMVKRGGENQNPYFNDPMFRRFFGWRVQWHGRCTTDAARGGASWLSPHRSSSSRSPRSTRDMLLGRCPVTWPCARRIRNGRSRASSPISEASGTNCG